MKAAFLPLCIIFWFGISSLHANPLDSVQSGSQKHQKFDPARDAKNDIEDALLLAKKTNKRVLLDIGGEWCIWCLRLDSLFMQNKDLQDYLNKHYVVVKINVSDENKNTKVLSHYPPVAGYPHIFILDKNGKLIHSQDTGELEFPKGYPVRGHDKKKVFAFLKKWAKK